MSAPNPTSPVGTAIEVAVSLLLILVVLAWCLLIIAPFISFVLWGAIIAISVHVPFCRLRERIGGKAAVLSFLVLGLGLVLVPAYLFGGSLLESGMAFYHSVETGAFDVPPPNESVKSWPLVGERLFSAWSAAAGNFEEFLETYNDQLRGLASLAASKAASLGLTVLLFIAATVIATIMLSNDRAVVAAMRLFARRVAGERGDEMLDLSVATIRSVTVGVLGIAVLQALGTGLGMWLVGVPGVGIWTLAVLIVVIAQLPALLIMAPVIVWVFSVESTTVAVVFTVWTVAVCMSDTVLKPLLLGRGVKAPMLVILLGAIGGMLLSGIVGLFVGAVVLAMGYSLFLVWLHRGQVGQHEGNEARDITP